MKSSRQIAQEILMKVAQPKPMLAMELEKHKKSLEFPVDVQPKLDGILATAWRDNTGKLRLTSRNGKDFNIPHLKTELSKILPKDSYLLGEVYLHGEPFQNIVSLVKREQPRQKLLKFYTTDLINKKNNSIPWNKRHGLLEQKINETLHVKKVPTLIADNLDKIKELQKKFEEEGYEGIIVRNPQSVYEPGKRSQGLLKSKEFKDDEFRITGFTQGTGAHKGTLIWELAAGDKKFKAPSSGSLNERKQLYKKVKDNPEDYVGQQLKVKYQMLSREGIPRFPIGLGIRLPEDIS
jgi:DNA ligase-1